ncbi:polysaccharide deacetylase family protein [Hyalangium rubrum]|uniref:Polysaccharide deacetylase family protein n=1 Tax=Hyalangium rubrum TaxID=3103134 RepID=A0ABU5H2E9_9BACT|nr:polysaccharide deacetylase family protein [Hyalangium sp. s54d21]MDY7227631.1 polysaccharide deacetylase family protein [Hyalangium sp. s54d21]
MHNTFAFPRSLRFGASLLALAAAGLLASCKGTASAPPASTPPAAASSTPTPAAPPAPVLTAPATLATDMAEIVTRYRQNIVLAADSATLDDETRDKVAVAGRMIFEQNRHALEELGEQFGEELTAAASSAAPPPGITAFLERLENSPELRDGDKLAFKDTVADLRAAIESLPQSPAWKAPLLTRIEEDQKALQEIQSLYEKELKEIFGRYETRGMTVRREAWESYLAFLKTLFTRDSILKAFEDSLQSLNEGMRGKGPRKEHAFMLTGQSLPDKTLVLTFDDGPHPRHTAAILGILEKYKVKSIFFEVGQNVAVPAKSKGTDAGTTLKRTSASASTEKIIQGGHLLANHSLTHAFLPKLSEERLTQEIDNSKLIIEQVSGTPVQLFRPPYGAFNARVQTALTERGMKAFLWNVDSLDWSDPIPTSIANRVVQEVDKYGRGVILLHDVHSQSVEALPLILETLQARGYQFVLWDGTNVLGEATEDGGTRSIIAPTPAPTPSETSLYRESFAVVIGINAYQKWPKLSYAVNDAEGVREMLVSKYRFKPENIQVLLDGEATREKILSALGDVLSNPDKVHRDDRVFVFFAGHGVTRKLPNGKSLGYIVPVDADTSNYQSQAISMTNFQDISEAIPAKHVFFVMDACYSGLALTRGGAPGGDVRKYLQEMTRRSTRQVLTAGGADEQVADQGPNGHSIFTWTLLQGMEGKADLNTDGFVTASELAAYVGPTVSSLSRQTPAFGSMVGSEGGEFILQLNHDGEFLTESSEQLDAEAIRLNAELDKVRQAIAEKQQRNQALAKQLAEARSQLAKLDDGGTPALVAPSLAPAQLARQHNDQGLTLYREKRYAEALAEFKTAAVLDATNAQAANNVGFVLFKVGEYEEAAKWLEKTVALDAGRAVAYPNLGDAYDKLGRTADAAKAYARYLELLPAGPASGAVKAKLAELRP